MSIRFRTAALAALLAVMAGCRAAETDPPALYVGGTPSYVEADQVSCISLSIRPEGFASLSAPVPDLTANLGSLSGLKPTSGGWTALACSGGETGRIHFQAPGYEVIEQGSLYFVPPEYDPSAVPAAVTSFSLRIDPALETVSLSSADLADPYSIGFTASLDAAQPFLFQGDTVFVDLTLAGTQVPLDLLRVRAVIDAVSGPGISVIDYDGLDPGTGFPYYSYGGFYSTTRAIATLGQPWQWTRALAFRLAAAVPFTVTGTAVTGPPVPRGRDAGFSIRPYLARARHDSILVSWKTDHESRSFVVYGPTPACEDVAGGALERNAFLQNWDGLSPPHFDSFLHRVEIIGLEPDARYYYRSSP